MIKANAIRCFSVIGYLIVIPLLLLAAFRIFHFENSRSVIEFETVTIYVLLPAYAVMAFAAAARRRVLFGAAVFLVLCHVIWFAPEIFGARHLASAKLRDATQITLYSQNVLYDNLAPQHVAQQIIKSNADLVMLQELSVRDYQTMQKTDAFASYPYSYVQPVYGPAGLGIFSKYPLSNTSMEASPGFPQMRAEVTIGDQNIVLWNVHLRAPVDGPPTNWLGDLKQLRQRSHSENRTTLIAGDFNSTFGHRPFRELLTDGFHEAAIDLGRGYSRTWPMDRPGATNIGGLVRFDHVVYKRGIQAVSQHEVSGGGSDHRAVVTRLAVFHS